MIDTEAIQKLHTATGDSGAPSDVIRDEAVQYAKSFKTSWIKLGQHLYSVYRDKLYHLWGYEKFEHYTQEELGLKKPVAMRLLKTYFFIEQEEPVLLNNTYVEQNQAQAVPTCETLNVLRLARGKKELTRDDYVHLRKQVFEKNKDASLVRKDLVALMKERQKVDPEAEREQRHLASVKKLVTAIRNFRKDMESLKLVSHDVMEEANVLLTKLEQEY
jgi:hypothetical protein